MNNMNYDGTLAMPQGHVAMTEDEIEYVEGGVSTVTVGGQIRAYYNSTETFDLIYGLTTLANTAGASLLSSVVGLMGIFGATASAVYNFFSMAVVNQLAKFGRDYGGVSIWSGTGTPTYFSNIYGGYKLYW